VVNTSPRYGKNTLPIVDNEWLSMLDYWQPHIVLWQPHIVLHLGIIF